jgi:hypothetical protein
VKTTEPFELFSKGTTPAVAVPDWTAAKTEGMLGDGVRVWVVPGKAVRVAWVCVRWGLLGLRGVSLGSMGDVGGRCLVTRYSPTYHLPSTYLVRVTRLGPEEGNAGFLLFGHFCNLKSRSSGSVVLVMFRLR